MTAETTETAGVWDLDPAHTHVEFSAKHMMVATVKGRFHGVTGRIQIDEADPRNSSVYAEIDVATIDTGVEQRDNHLRSNDFLNAGLYPKITFTSRRVEPAGKDHWRVTGDLTIRDVSREVVLDVEYDGRILDPFGYERAAFSARTSINRHDFGVTWNGLIEAGGVVVGDTVQIVIEATALRQANQSNS
jgi:polyisoprenoid-binding protein YceI